jgi:beta-1,4-mannosyl-glycoprotein beta-1,4-N-acetylglucosaminyltransferase
MIYDTFIFLNELDILEIRLKTLYPYVDRFVLVESDQSFSTLTRKDTFCFEENRLRFAPFLDKIVYIRLEGEYKTEGSYLGSRLARLFRKKNALAWENEAFTRNALLRGMTDARADDVVMISDVDEIPRPAEIPRAVEALAAAPIVGFAQRMYRYFFNCYDYDSFWTGTKLARFETFRRMGPEAVKASKPFAAVPDSGWHFCSIGSMEQLLHKGKSYSHFDRCYRGKYRDVEKLKELLVRNVIEKGVDIYPFSDSKYRLVPIDETFPPCLREDRERYGEFIYGEGW